MGKEPTINPWKLLAAKQVYESPWISVEHHDVLTPVGSQGTYSVVHFKKLAVGVVPLDEDNNTWIVGQYRYPLHTYTWEIPEGGGNPEEAPIEAAKRELLEECGISANEYIPIQELQLSNSATDEIAFLFLAKQLSFTKAQPDDNEQLTVKKIPFEELYQMVLSGQITDSLSVAAVLKIKVLQMEGKL